MTPDPQPRRVVGQSAEEPIPLKQLLKLLSVAALDCGTYPGDLNSEEYSRLCDREQIARARIIAHFDFAQELTATTIARLREELAECQRFAAAARAMTDAIKPNLEELVKTDEKRRAKLTAYRQAAAAVLKKVVGTISDGRGWLPDNDETRQLLSNLAAAHRTATAHDGEREK